MTAVTNGSSRAVDPITLEVLRSRLEAIAEDAAGTIERTGVSPVITESHDFGTSVLDADGNLIAGGGWVSMHYVASTRTVRATIGKYGDTIAPGDVFIANDPYNGGGLHANDVVVVRPIFVGARRVAWAALMGHMMDIGGMVMGSFAPAATECYQEAFRMPPVRIFRQGEEVTEVWDIFRTNVRIAPLIEMDLRGLVAGAHVADEKVSELAASVGIEDFLDGVVMLQELSERELRARISAMPDGTYRVVAWNEWEDELFTVPCTLTIDGDRLIFDFEGASPQAPHYFNSQPYIIKSVMLMYFARIVAGDLPFTEGLVAPIELRCPERTIVNASPPAPMNNGHVHVAQTAAEAMMACVRLALWAADPPLAASRLIYGWGGSAAMAVTSWTGLDADRSAATWAFIDGAMVGSTGGNDHDGPDLASSPVGMESPPASADVEVLESWYPMLITERRVRPGLNGPGSHRSGGGSQMKFRPYGTDRVVGQMLGIREWLPLEGVAGGFPGSTALFLRHRADGTTERIGNQAADVVIDAGETFEFRCPSGGGYGDPVDRDADVVADDVAAELITVAEASAVYGVVLHGDGSPDADATEQRRAAILADRLARASAPRQAVSTDDAAAMQGGAEKPLYPGVVHRGAVAYAVVSGAPLAVAPDHWTDGCAVLEDRRPGPGPEITVRAYLDPLTGHSLYVEAVPAGEPRAFEVSPNRWTALA